MYFINLIHLFSVIFKRQERIQTMNKELLENIKKTHNKVKFAVVDIDGILRGKVIHIDKFESMLQSGAGFCDVVFGWDAADKCYENSEVTGWHSGYPDAQAKIDLTTFRRIPWENQQPFLLADFDTEAALGVCPRTLLKKVIQEAKELGFEPIFAQEFEWFNFEKNTEGGATVDLNNLKPISTGMFGYSMLRPTLKQKYFNQLFDQLASFDIDLEGLHTETGPGVYEAAIKYDHALAAADKAVLFKNSVKEIAYQNDIVASFMAKWNTDLPGCSGHIHQSLWSKSEKRNLFYTKEETISSTMEAYLAGVLTCLPHLLPMYAPTVNSYKRLQKGTWAPNSLSWGKENRTTAVRVIDGSEKSTRLELRVPGSDVNPYLAMAATLASGLHGIKNQLKLETPETIGSAYTNNTATKFPRNLKDAAQKMKESELASALLGEQFVNHFVKTREWEWKEFEQSVTNWEINRYFEII